MPMPTTRVVGSGGQATCVVGRRPPSRLPAHWPQSSFCITVRKPARAPPAASHPLISYNPSAWGSIFRMATTLQAGRSARGHGGRNINGHEGGGSSRGRAPHTAPLCTWGPRGGWGWGGGVRWSLHVQGLGRSCSVQRQLAPPPAPVRTGSAPVPMKAACCSVLLPTVPCRPPPVAGVGVRAQELGDLVAAVALLCRPHLFKH